MSEQKGTYLATTVEYNDTQMGVIRTQIARGATDEEFDYFIEICKQTRLNPLMRQIYFVKRYDSTLKKKVGAVQVAIDGFRLSADRTGKYAGQVGPQWCGSDGLWVDAWLSIEPPAAARVGVLRSDFQQPLWAVARYAAYVQNVRDGGPNTFWKKMPDVMLAKCAESLALRKAFPAELSGLYTAEEMGQAGNVVDVTAAVVPEHADRGGWGSGYVEPDDTINGDVLPDHLKKKSRRTDTAPPGNGDDTDQPEPETVQDNGKKAPSRESMLKRISELQAKLFEITEGKRYNGPHFKAHLKKHYETTALAKLTADQLIALGKSMKAEMDKLEAAIDDPRPEAAQVETRELLERDLDDMEEQQTQRDLLSGLHG